MVHILPNAQIKTLETENYLLCNVSISMGYWWQQNRQQHQVVYLLTIIFHVPSYDVTSKVRYHDPSHRTNSSHLHIELTGYRRPSMVHITSVNSRHEPIFQKRPGY